MCLSEIQSSAGSHSKNRNDVARIAVGICHVTHYSWRVIKSFADQHTAQLFASGRSKRLPPDILRRSRMKLEYIDLAVTLSDLKVLPGNRLHKLGADRKGQYSIAINDQWRICFRFVDGDAYEVEVTDYH
jgi:toxin HigB-1